MLSSIASFGTTYKATTSRLSRLILISDSSAVFPLPLIPVMRVVRHGLFMSSTDEMIDLVISCLPKKWTGRFPNEGLKGFDIGFSSSQSTNDIYYYILCVFLYTLTAIIYSYILCVNYNNIPYSFNRVRITQVILLIGVCLDLHLIYAMFPPSGINVLIIFFIERPRRF